MSFPDLKTLNMASWIFFSKIILTNEHLHYNQLIRQSREYKNVSMQNMIKFDFSGEIFGDGAAHLLFKFVAQFIWNVELFQYHALRTLLYSIETNQP